LTVHRLSRWPVATAVLALVTLGILTSSCTSIGSPRGWASPVLSDDLLLVSNRDELKALNVNELWISGRPEPRWKFPSGEEDDDIDAVALYGTPAVTTDSVFVPTYDGILYALDRETGAVIWSYETDGPLIGGVAVSDGTVYFGSSDGNVYALDASSGALRWKPFETGDEIWSTPAVDGDALYVTSLDGRLYALDAANGTEGWSFETDAGIASPPVVDKDTGLVLVGGFDSRLRAIDPATQEEIWSVKADNWFWTEPLVADGVVYAGSLDGGVFAVDAASGESVWPQPFSTEGPVRAAPVMADDSLVVVDKDGDVYAIDSESGASAVVDWPLELESDVFADPIVAVNTGAEGDQMEEEVVVVTTGGDLVRIDAATLRLIAPPEPLGD
jgi:outer membrane protein assembly factor BamB